MAKPLNKKPKKIETQIRKGNGWPYHLRIKRMVTISLIKWDAERSISSHNIGWDEWFAHFIRKWLIKKN